MPDEEHSIEALARQSRPVDTTAPYTTTSLKDKTIVITGGASGFGAAFAARWAAAGAQIVLGDVDEAGARAVAASLPNTSKSARGPGLGFAHHAFACDVTSWDSQAAFFRNAQRVAHAGGIDAVVPNAGIAETQSVAGGKGFECPRAVDDDDAGDKPPGPCKPDLRVPEVNLIGVLYTVHLALYWLKQNPAPRDGHLLLISSVAGLAGLPGQALYTAAKHAVTGLFRSLRATAGQAHPGLRVNMLCPYFVATPILPVAGHLLLAGAGKGRVDDVVDAATRLMADEGIRGRALVVGPPVHVLGKDAGDVGDVGDLLATDDFAVHEASAGHRHAVWECYAHDLERCEAFTSRFVRMLNLLVLVRGWIGLVVDLVGILVARPQKKKSA